METLRKMYSADVNPIPHPEEWCVPVEVSRRVVRAPDNPRQAGRPRTSRIQSTAESSSRSRSRSCSRCHKIGHYRSSCNEEVPIQQITDYEVNGARRPKTCSICHEADHTKRRCPLFDPSA